MKTNKWTQYLLHFYSIYYYFRASPVIPQTHWLQKSPEGSTVSSHMGKMTILRGKTLVLLQSQVLLFHLHLNQYAQLSAPVSISTWNWTPSQEKRRQHSNPGTLLKSAVKGSLCCLPCSCHIIMYKAVQPSAQEFVQSTAIRFLAYQSVLLHPDMPWQRRHIEELIAECVRHSAALAVL